MTRVQRFSRRELPATPWKNGGGSTREILSWPPGAGLDRFDWRVSIATIAASGPFSVFEGVDRTIMLLEGDGVHLRGVDLDHRLDAPHRPFAFSGDLPLDCTLLGRLSSDFNVMSRRARGTADVRVIDAAETLAGRTHGLLMSLTGRWRADDEILSEGQGLWWAAVPMSWSLLPDDSDARLVSVGWTSINAKDAT